MRVSGSAGMLTHLIIENLALVERLELPLGPGLNVLSGETGAGKSVLVNALLLLLGGRANADVVRSGANEGAVEALFEVPVGGALAQRLEARGVEADGELVVRRTISKSGKGRVLLNGQMATVSMLSEVLRGLLDVTSQHEHVSLLDPDMHLELVDAFGGLGAERSAVVAAHGEWIGYQAALDALLTDEAERERRIDYLRFAVDEIRSVDPQPGELLKLEEEHKRLRSLTELTEGLQRAEGALYSEDGAAVEAVGKVQRELIRLAGLDQRLGALSGTAAGLLAELEEFARALSRYQGSLRAEPERLHEVEERVQSLRRLAKKYGGSVEAVIEAGERMSAELDDLEHEDARRSDLTSLLEAASAALEQKAKVLTAARQKVVRAFEQATEIELAALSMEKTRLQIQLTPLPKPSARGAENAELLIAPNPGEPMRPLRKTASGGELSRVLLALKHVLAHRAAVGTYVFDEIDTGIGGGVAEVLGRKLREVAQSTQAIVVTHLPQVAAFAEVHFRVQKGEQNGRTVTTVGLLDEDGTIEELARMLGGVQITTRTRELAREMRSRARGEPDPRPKNKRAKAGA